jgi:hypothetical protein
MIPLVALWLPILVAAVAVFVASSIVHMALPMHKGDYQRLPHEDELLDAMRKAGLARGHYMFPCPTSMKDMGSPEMQAKFQRGPVGSVVVRPAGGYRMGAALGQWFVFCVVVSTLVAYAAGLHLPAGAPGSSVARITSVVALCGYAFSSVCDSIWKGVSWSITAKFVVDGALYAAVTAGVFAWLWPAA